MKKILLIIIVLASGLTMLGQAYSGRKFKDPKNILNNKYCTDLFKSAEGTIIDITNESVQGWLNILDWMTGRVAGLQVYTTRNGLRVPVIRGSVAAVFVDEMPVDPGYLNYLPVADIAMIKVIKSPFVGAAGCNSAVAIYTLRGDDDDENE